MSKPSAKNSFDASLRELEQLVESLEQGETPLEELMEKYEKGTRLLAHCQKILQDAELRIEQLRLTGDKAEFVARNDLVDDAIE